MKGIWENNEVKELFSVVEDYKKRINLFVRRLLLMPKSMEESQTV